MRALLALALLAEALGELAHELFHLLLGAAVAAAVGHLRVLVLAGIGLHGHLRR